MRVRSLGLGLTRLCVWNCESEYPKKAKLSKVLQRLYFDFHAVIKAKS